jgi:hypothetical protein
MSNVGQQGIEMLDWLEIVDLFLSWHLYVGLALTGLLCWLIISLVRARLRSLSFAFPSVWLASFLVSGGKSKRTGGSAVLMRENAIVQLRQRPNKPLVPTRNGEAPLLAAQRRR